MPAVQNKSSCEAGSSLTLSFAYLLAHWVVLKGEKGIREKPGIVLAVMEKQQHLIGSYVYLHVMVLLSLKFRGLYRKISRLLEFQPLISVMVGK